MRRVHLLRKFAIMIIAIILTTALVSCSGGDKGEKETKSLASEETESEADETTEETKEEETKEDKTDDVTEEKLEVNIASLKGPTSMGLVKVMEDSANDEAKYNYNFNVVGTADEISPGIVSGDLDIAAVPANLASVLFNKSNGGVVVAGINTLGVLYIVETGEQISSVEDLRGKTIYSTGKGTTPEYTLNYLLTSNGIDPETDVTIEYKSEATEVAAMLSESDDAVAMLPQPYVTTVMMNNDKVRVALDIAKEWEKVDESGSAVTTGVVIVNKEFFDNNPEVVDNFLEEYSESVTYVNSNVEDAANLIEKFDIFKAAVAKKAIPECNIVLITGDEMKEKLEGYLSVLHEQNPNAVGGELPTADFYYTK